MTENLAIKALSTKKRSNLTPVEAQQINDLQKVYGKNNVILAIRFAKSTHFDTVAKMLLQHCGVRPFLPPSVQNIIPDKASAEKLLPPENSKSFVDWERLLGKSNLKSKVEHHDENSLEGDEFLANYDIEEFDFIESTDE